MWTGRESITFKRSFKIGTYQDFMRNRFTEDIVQIKCVHSLPDAMGYIILKKSKKQKNSLRAAAIRIAAMDFSEGVVSADIPCRNISHWMESVFLNREKWLAGSTLQIWPKMVCGDLLSGPLQALPSILSSREKTALCLTAAYLDFT